MALAGLAAGHLQARHGADHVGPLLESFAVAELTKQRGWSECEYTLSHYRDRNGAEVDIVIETAQGVIAVEVKSAAAATRAHFKHLVGLREKLGDEFLAGVVLNLGSAQQAGDRLWALPISSFWETSG